MHGSGMVISLPWIAVMCHSWLSAICPKMNCFISRSSPSCAAAASGSERRIRNMYRSLFISVYANLDGIVLYHHNSAFHLH